MLAAKRFLISGRVQGVFFRASTRREAERLRLAGRAINLPDGRVEVLAVGEAGQIAALEAWLHRGPPMARVDAVESSLANADVLAGEAGFTTG